MKTLRQIVALVSMLLLLVMTLVVFGPVRIIPAWAQSWAAWVTNVLWEDF
jgi:Sec-independent protein translocase protein TatA